MNKHCTPWYVGYPDKNGQRTIFGHDEAGNGGIPILLADKDTLEEDLDLIITAVNAWKAEDKN